jgi:thiamine biosynthesis lipoprotein
VTVAIPAGVSPADGRAAGGSAVDGPPRTAAREARAMGSPLRLQVAGGPPATIVDAAWSAITDEFELTEQALSRFRTTSEVHRVRLADGHAAAPSRRLVAALSAADRARRITDGRFDPRVLHVLERLGSRPLEVPGSRSAERAETGGPILRRDGRQGPVNVPVPVDFGGIGKGLALRWAARRAVAVIGERPFLLEAGGDIVGRGAPGPDGWRVGIEDPRPSSADGERLVVLELPPAGGAVATSSVRRARWRDPDGRLVHHLIDPRTGEPGGEGLLAVTVQAGDPAWSEVWSKALFLAGDRGIVALARSRGLAAWWVTTEGAVEMTPAARLRTVWVAAEA